MGENVPKLTKKFLKIVRVMCYMVRKGISKGKLLADLNIMMKRAKFSGKLESIHNLMFHHHHHHHHHHKVHNATNSDSDDNLSYPVPLNEHESSCNNANTPSNNHIFHLKKRKHSHGPPSNDDIIMAVALHVLNSATASPALPGFGSTPTVRQLRVTDSPYPLRDNEVDNHVDEAAEDFIMKFYKDLKRQNAMV